MQSDSDHRAERARERAGAGRDAEPEARTSAHAGRGGADRRPRRRRLVPRGPADPWRVPDQAAAAVRARAARSRASSARRPAARRLGAGDRVAAFCMLGGFAEVAVAPAHFTFPLPETLDFRQGAGLVLNYHTAYFALVTRGRLTAGETVLVHGAAGGVGTAVLQVAEGLGATDDRGRLDAARRSASLARPAPTTCCARTGRGRTSAGRSAAPTSCIDPVGGDRFTDSCARCNEGGRVVVVGFTEGSIPRSGSTACCSATPRSSAPAGARARSPSRRYVRRGRRPARGADRRRRVAPIVGASFPLERAADALALIDARRRRRQGRARRRLRRASPREVSTGAGSGMLNARCPA